MFESSRAGLSIPFDRPLSCADLSVEEKQRRRGPTDAGQSELASPHRLAPLPTTTPESAGLFALGRIGSLSPVTAHQ